MTVSYTIDSELQVVFTRVVGVIDGTQLHEHQNRLRDDPCFQPDMRELMDCMGVEDVELKTIVNSQAVKGSPWGSSARRAIVVPNLFVFGLLRIFQTLMSDAHGEISMFYDIESAKSWLDL
jgi:hypothetical protein